MRVRRIFSVGLSITVIIVQLMLPLSRALSSQPVMPGPTEGISRPLPSASLPINREAVVIPVADDEPLLQASAPARATAPPATIAHPSAPAAPQQSLPPFGTGNNNYGQTQRDTDNPQNHPGHHFAGPVNLVNGNFFLTAGDFFIPDRGLSLQLARSYNSLAATAGFVGPFGPGWTHSYNTQVISETDGITLTVRDADGALHNYHTPQLCPDDLTATCYDSPPGLYRQLRDTSASYELRYKNGTRQFFDDQGRLVQIVDRHNNEINLFYDFCGASTTTLCTVFGPAWERPLGFHYIDGPAGLLIDEVYEGVPDGRTITYQYDEWGRLTGVTYPEGPAKYDYDDQNRMTGYNDQRQPAGVRQAERVAYDVDDRVITVTYDLAVDSFFDITYDLEPEIGIEQGAVTAVEIADGAGQLSRVEFDSNANAVYEGDWFPDLGIWIGKWWWWHPWWWLLWQKVDANWHVTSYDYDAWGNTIAATNGLSATQRFLWEKPYYETSGTTYGNVLSATNSLGVTTLYQYDYTGNVMTEVQAAGTPDESATLYESDEFGQLVRQTDNAVQVTEYAYDWFGNTTVITDARGNVTHNEFDVVGRPITTIDQAGNATTYVYDGADRLLSVTDPEGGATRYTYSPDGRDNLVQLVTANGVTTTYGYDGLDRLVAQTNSMGQATAYKYDPLNRLIWRTDADGRRTEYEYDAKSRMTKAEYYEKDGIEPYQVNEYRYDPAGNLIWMSNENVRLAYEYDAIDQRTRIDMWTPTWGNTRTLQLQRDPDAGNLTQVTGPGGYHVEYQYDNLNRLVTVTDPDGGATIYEYDAASRLEQVVHPADATATYFYNETNHLTELRYDLSGGETASYSYEYDGCGNLISEMDEGEVYTYTYDTVGRVISATSELQGDVSFEYDGVGNRLVARGLVSDTEFTYDAHSRLTQAGDATFTHNEMGARTEAQMSSGPLRQSRASTSGPMSAPGGMQAAASTVHYSYDNDMRLTHAEPGLTFLYDPMGNLIGTIDSEGNYRYFLRDGKDIYLELDGSGDVLAQYTVGGQGVLSMWRDGHRYLFLYDGRGRVRRVVDLATWEVVTWYSTYLSDPGSGLYFYNPIRIRGAWWFPEVYLVLFGEGVFWDSWFGVFLVKAWPWLYWPFGPFHPWRPIFRFWPWPWPWPRPWGWPWPRPWPFLWPWPGAWVRPWVIWPFWPWVLRPWWPWWYWRWWWGWVWWGRWWCWHPWWWFCKWWWWPWWHPWWWWGYWWFPWWWWQSCWWWPWHWWWWYWWWWPWWWPGQFWWCWWWWWPWWWWWWPWWWPPILGPPEVGDAFDGPYPSYRRNQGAVHGIWWYEWLGVWRDGEWDSDQADADQYDDGVAVDPDAGTLVFTPTVSGGHSYGPAASLNIHGWADWNCDGDWDDAGEFIVNWSGYPGDGAWPAGQSNFGVTWPFTVSNVVFNGSNEVDLWLRFRLDYASNLENPRGYTRFGEVEDHKITIQAADVAITKTVQPTTGATLVYTDTQGLTTTVDIPVGAVTATTTLVYTPISAPTHPISPNLRFACHAFNLEAQQSSTIPGFTFQKPVTVTIHYSDADVEGVDESSLTLDYWDKTAGQWLDVTTTCTPTSTYDRHPDENWLAVPLCHLSEFALVGERQHHIYLPLVLRNYP